MVQYLPTLESLHRIESRHVFVVIDPPQDLRKIEVLGGDMKQKIIGCNRPRKYR
jgi:hypothetical protein